jgi:ribonucleotide monophosphatase NagD (HAD superfamily)
MNRNRLSVFLVSSIAFPALGAPTSLNHPLRPRVAAKQLNDVVDTVHEARAKGKHPVVVFDIDGTLLTERGRLKRIPGAQSYVNALAQDKGVQVVYLTGRREPARAVTEAELTHFGFPLGGNVKLMLNRSPLPAVAFKKEAQAQILKLGRPVAYFDNEPINDRMFRAENPAGVKVFRLATTSSYPDYQNGNQGIDVIRNFSR